MFPDVAGAWPGMMPQMPPPDMYTDTYGAPIVPGPASMHIMPPMSISLEALLSKLPSVLPAPTQAGWYIKRGFKYLNVHRDACSLRRERARYDALPDGLHEFLRRKQSAMSAAP